MSFIHTFFYFIVSLLLGLIFPLHAAEIDQQNIDSNEQLRQLERQRQLRQQQEVKPDVREAIEQLKNSQTSVSDQIPEQESPCFVINHIVLIGESATSFQFALDRVMSQHERGKPILGHCFGVAGINGLMTQVQNAIVAKGFVTTRVLAAPQDLSTGELKLTVIPGKVNAIRFTPDSRRYVSAWNAMLTCSPFAVPIKS